MEKIKLFFRKFCMKNHSSNLIYISQAAFWNLSSFKHKFKLMFLLPRSTTECSKILSNKASTKPMKTVTKSMMDYIIPPIMILRKSAQLNASQI